MASVSRRIQRNITGRPRKTKAGEITPASLAAATGLDLYHARIALYGTTISKSQVQTAQERDAARELKASLGTAAA